MVKSKTQEMPRSEFENLRPRVWTTRQKRKNKTLGLIIMASMIEDQRRNF